jgi:hypothetical protein
MSAWLAAKISGHANRASFYLERAGVLSFRPIIHKYYKDKRTQQERFRVAELFQGYIFIRPESPLEYARAKDAIGVSYILGGYSGERFIPKEIPLEWIEELERSGPMIVGKRRKFERGQHVRAAVNAISEIIGTVEAHNGRRVTIRAVMFGAEMKIDVDEDKIELRELQNAS